MSEKHYNLLVGSMTGGATTGIMRTDATLMYHVLTKDEKYSRDDALDKIENELSLKHRNLYEGVLKVGDTKHLASQWRRYGGDVSQFTEKALTTFSFFCRVMSMISKMILIWRR